jgi:hypothetical protein
MSTVRASFWWAGGLILLTATAWAFLVIFLQTVSVSVERVEKQALTGFNPIHVGPQRDSVCLPELGIPLQANSARRIAGRDFAEWLQASGNLKNEAWPISQMEEDIGKQTHTELHVVPLSNAASEITFPVENHGSGTVILLIAIPPHRSGRLSVQWVTKTDQTASRSIKAAAMPAFEMSEILE